MKILLCAIVALPLVLFGVESVSSSNLKSDKTNATNQKMLYSKGKSSDSKDKSKSDSTAPNDKSKDKSVESSLESQDKSLVESPSKSPQTSQDKSPPESLESPTTKEESGWMIGVGFLMGGPVGKTQGFGAYLDGSAKRFHYGLEVLLGHKTFFDDGGIFGMRLYLDYNYRKTRGTDMSAHFVGLNIDTLFNFTQSEIFKFGMLLGVRSGIGYGLGDMYKMEIDLDWTADLNVGARFVIYDHNAFELLLQPRFGLWILKGKNSMYGIVRYVYTF